MRLSRSLHQFRAQICHKPWRAKSLWLAAAYTSYGAADKILRRLTAYEVYGGLWRRLGALGKVGILDTVLLRVSSGTIRAIFIEIGSYLTDREQKISWRSFFETRCTKKSVKSNVIFN